MTLTSPADFTLPPRPQSLGEPVNGLRVLVLGTCQVGWLAHFASDAGVSAGHALYVSRKQSSVPDVDPANFDLVIFSMTLRAVMEEALDATFYDIDMVLPRLTTVERRDQIIARCTEIFQKEIQTLRSAFIALPIFVVSFLEPSFNYLGGLIDRFDPCSPQQVIRKINETLGQITSLNQNVFFFDSNEIFNFVGRAHLQDDVAHGSLHGAYLSDWDVAHDVERLQTSKPLMDTFRTKEVLPLAAIAYWHRILDNYKVISQSDTIKLIIVDIDDTIWRGVAAEEHREMWWRAEGWPIGFIESLLFFKRRGGLLAIVSKNDHEPTLDRLQKIWNGALLPEDFVSVKINWERKSDNIRETLKSVNLLPQNVLFIDDNPREIDEVKSQFPDIRTLSADHYDWRRIVLQAPELQVAHITEESRTRTASTQALVARSIDTNALPRDEWLQSLELRQVVGRVTDENAVEFNRAFELINKTNQFNTTGQRWDRSEFVAFLRDGGYCLFSSVRDKTVDNGIVCIALVKQNEIVQVVLSCRVFGLGVETVVGSVAAGLALSSGQPAVGRIIETGKNLSCHKFFEHIGFTRAGNGFEGTTRCEIPRWIVVTILPDVEQLIGNNRDEHV